jgi:hypothetical protein
VEQYNIKKKMENKIKYFGIAMIVFLAFQIGRVYDLGSKSKSVHELNVSGLITRYNDTTYYLKKKDSNKMYIYTQRELSNLYNISDYNSPIVIIQD